MTAVKLSLFSVLCATIGSAGCAAPQRVQFQLNMTTQSDDGSSLEGVTVWHGEQTLGTTNNAGQLAVAVEAVEGSNFEVRFDCPKGYTATRDRVLVPLRQASEVELVEEAGERSSSYSLTLECQPQKRKAMLVVQTTMANVPVMLGKKLISITNQDGIAHASLEFSAKDVFDVWLDTTSSSLLRPQNPNFSFVMPDHDEVFVVQEAFRMLQEPVVVVKKKKTKKKPTPVVEKRSRPTQITGKKIQWGTVK